MREARSLALPFASLLAFGLLIAGCGEGICDPGTVGCPCLETGECRLPGLSCERGLCVEPAGACDDDGRCPPSEPRCYTPCSADIVGVDGVLRACGDDGLLEGCLEGSICDRGSCIPELLVSPPDGMSALDLASHLRVMPGECLEETDCPRHQTCIAGRCYSDCDPETPCSQGATCFERVCRQECREETPCEQAGFVCHDGICLPSSRAQDSGTAPPEGELRVLSVATDGTETESRALRFSTGTQGAELILENTSGGVQTFTVRKVDERVRLEDGSLSVLRADDGDTPLSWLEMGTNAPAAVQSFPVFLDAGARTTLRFASARNAAFPEWQGTIEVSSPELGARQLTLSYGESPRARWQGKVYYFGNFEDGRDPLTGDSPLERWIADRSDTASVDATQNALLQVWARFRSGVVPLGEMTAFIRSTVTASFQDRRVQELCSERFGPAAACAPYGGSGSASVLLYTSAANADRIPSGVVELDISINLREASEDEAAERCAGQPHCFVGRIDTEEALQYPGNPEVALRFADDPTVCDASMAGGCLAGIETLSARVAVGGRYAPESSDLACAAGDDLLPREVPWLVTGFSPRGATPFGEPGRVFRQCTDSLVPFGDGLANQLFSTANPIPDGRARARDLSLVDGVMVNQATVLLLVEETTDGFDRAGMERLPTYSLMVLERQPEELEAADFQGNLVVDDRAPPADVLARSCAPALVTEVSGDPARDELGELALFQRENLARAVVRGHTASTDPATLDADRYSVHYVCVFDDDLVLSDGMGGLEPARTVQRQPFGAGADGTVVCQPWGTAIYFAVDRNVFGLDFDPTILPCNDRPRGGPETCLETLRGWAAVGFEGTTANAGGDPILHLLSRRESLFGGDAAAAAFDLTYRCASPELASCDEDRRNLIAGKIFLAPILGEVFWPPIETEIHDAFRYKTQFASQAGRAVGFAPTMCQGSGSDLVPYCYDPVVIERIVERTDCALALYQAHLEAPAGSLARLGDPTAAILRDYLRKSFGQLQTDNPYGDPIVEDGFERLHAELLILLGDEALTASFASRFDLAGTGSLAFEGSAFEAEGIDLEGAVGLEMYRLYQAIQYYELVLDRFYGLVPEMWESLSYGSAGRYLTQRTVTSYVQRVIQASTQRARAAAEISRRYQLLNRPDLARAVIERSYTRAYTESQILTQVMRAIMGVLDPSALAQVIYEIEQAQRSYRIAMLEMREGYDRISDGVNYFGLPPDHIPFPALDEDSVNGFEVMLARAFERLDRGAEDEERALASRRDFDIDAAGFQAELVALQQDYEAQLGDLCGTFAGTDGRIHAAIRRNAHLIPDPGDIDDPCGAMGNGELFIAGADVQTRELELRRVRQEIVDVQRQNDLMVERVRVQCQLIEEDAVRYLEHQRAVDGLANSIVSLENAINGLDRGLAYAAELSDRIAGAVTDSSAAQGVSAGVYGVAGGIHLIATSVIDASIRSKQRQIADRQRNYEALQVRRECDYLQADLVFDLRELHMGMDLLEIDSLNAIWNTQVAASEIQRLDNLRKRLEAEWDDSRQLALNVAAAQNDPNQRIFRNEAIVSADRSFEEAVRAAYEATRIYEYYTGTSYPGWERLFFARMIGSGEHNLRRYVLDLEDAYFAFEDGRGNPDSRVAVISLKDNVFQVPRYSEDGLGRILTQDERTEIFREQLQDPGLLDNEGFLTVGFPTTFEQLSPLTGNHKILFIEVEMFGEGTGDPVGRIYLRQRGTGVVDGTDGQRRYHTFDPAIAVMNPLFNGDRSLGQDSDGAITGPTRSIYRSYRFRERPFVQTQWELVLNQRTESVNEDIDLAGIDDIVLYVFYTDFTVE